LDFYRVFRFSSCVSIFIVFSIFIMRFDFYRVILLLSCILTSIGSFLFVSSHFYLFESFRCLSISIEI